MASAHPTNRNVIGWPIEDLDSPALLLDGAIADRNIRRMADFFRGRLCRLRPQFKNHRCPPLARHQLAAGGTAGIGCTTVGEAEILAAQGFHGIVLGNAVVGRHKIERVAELARKVELRVAVDDARQAVALSEAASAAKTVVGVLIDLDVADGPCGVAPGKAALELARHIDCLPKLRLDGLQAREGRAVQVSDFERRAEAARQVLHCALETRRRIEDDGIPVGILSGGSSATYQITGMLDGIDEVQAGTYAVMDWRYADLSPEFDIALTVLARMVGKHAGAAVLDVGLSGIACDMGLPRVKDYPQAEIASPLEEEHCLVRRAPDWQIGEVVQLVPSHATSTCGLYREIHIHEEGRVIEVWPIVAPQ